jgi:hypothetical protein
MQSLGSFFRKFSNSSGNGKDSTDESGRLAIGASVEDRLFATDAYLERLLN